MFHCAGTVLPRETGSGLTSASCHVGDGISNFLFSLPNWSATWETLLFPVFLPLFLLFLYGGSISTPAIRYGTD